MKLIFISGPTGSGKTSLSNQILLKIENGIVLSTDNYYKTGLISKLLSKIVQGYFDREISFNNNLFKNDFNFILNNRVSIHERSYDFKNKTIKNFLKRRNNIEFIIVEGIFSKQFSRTLLNQNYYFLELKINKNECMNRVVQRDFKERGKLKKKAKNDFLKSWAIYYEKYKYQPYKKNPKHYIITKNTNIDLILKKIFNVKY